MVDVITTDYRLLSRAPQARQRLRTLFCCVSVFLAQYCQASPMIAPFLAASRPGLLIGADAVGVVFAAYPMATALATPLPDMFVARIGVRATVLIGLCATSFGSLLFGLIGTLLEGQSAVLVGAGLVLARTLGGIGAALAEAGCLTAISVDGWGDDLGKALSVVEVTTGVGAALGAALGGYLYYLGQYTWVGSFMLPMLVGCTLPLSVCPCVLLILSSVTDANGDAAAAGTRTEPSAPSTTPEGAGVMDGSAASSRSLIGLTCTAVSLAISATVFEGLNPLLEPHFVGAPFSLSIPEVCAAVSNP